MEVELYAVEKGRVYATDGGFEIKLRYRPTKASTLGGGLSNSRLESIHAIREALHDAVLEGSAPAIYSDAD